MRTTLVLRPDEMVFKGMETGKRIENGYQRKPAKLEYELAPYIVDLLGVHQLDYIVEQKNKRYMLHIETGGVRLRSFIQAMRRYPVLLYNDRGFGSGSIRAFLEENAVAGWCIAGSGKDKREYFYLDSVDDAALVKLKFHNVGFRELNQSNLKPREVLIDALDG